MVAKNLDSAQWAKEYWNFAWRAYLTFYASLVRIRIPGERIRIIGTWGNFFLTFKNYLQVVLSFVSLCSRWFWTVFMWRLPPISRSCSGRNSNSQQKITEQFWEIIFWFEYLDHFEILEKCPKIPRQSVAIEISIQKFSCICTHFVKNILCVLLILEIIIIIIYHHITHYIAPDWNTYWRLATSYNICLVDALITKRRWCFMMMMMLIYI